MDAPQEQWVGGENGMAAQTERLRKRQNDKTTKKHTPGFRFSVRVARGVFIFDVSVFGVGRTYSLPFQQ